ncbi:MAG TPA: alpha/beta hydrolase [Acidimicrobiales bacterium]
MADLRHRTIETNGISMHLAEDGPDDGPLVLMCHGFPESWYSWRHQLPALAAAGYHAVAPDMRGYGLTDAPADGRAYSQLHHVGDMVGLLDALGAPTAVIVGHDWGAPVAWNAALLRPDRFPAVAVLSVPWTPRSPVAPLTIMRNRFAGAWFYFVYFQDEGVAEAELDPRPGEFLTSFLYTISGDAPEEVLGGLVGPDDGSGIMGHLRTPEALPPWLTQDDIDFYAGEFARTGFRGPLSWYRCTDLTWELTAAFADRRIEQPALFITGDREPVLAMTPGALDALATNVPGLRRTVVLPGCGHWTQQERPAEVNEALLAFIAEL